MKRFASSLFALISAIGAAHAGYRHPVADSGPEAHAIQSTPHRPTAPAPSRSRMLPDRMPSAARTSPALPRAATGPLPKAAQLPAGVRFNIPEVYLNRAKLGDGMAVQQPEALKLRGGPNRTEIHSFLRQVRALPMPTRDYGKNAKGKEIAQRFRQAIEPTRFVSFRTPYELKLAKVGKIPGEPSTIHYENMVRRIDSLFFGLNGVYPRAILGLWQLSELSTNSRELQARDSLFAGLLSLRAGWEAPASNLFASGAYKGLDREDRYLRILWNQLDSITNQNHVDRVVGLANAKRVAKAAPIGDAANFAMAKRSLTEPTRPPAAPLPSPEIFAERIQATAYRERFHMLRALGELRSAKAAMKAKGLERLRLLESTGLEETRAGARLALARASLQSGNPNEALELYRAVPKNGKNRLEVLSEQIYAEYSAGEYQGSIGKAVGLQSAFFQYGFAPDVHFVEILSRQATCDFGGAEEGVKRFHARYQPELAALEALLQRAVAPASYYEELVSYHAQLQPMRFQRYLLQLGNVMENQKTMNQALGELKKIDELGQRQAMPERPQGWDGFTLAMREKWAQRAAELRKKSAQAALREVAYMAKRLRHEFAQIELMDLDISTAAARNYHRQSALNYPAQKAAEAELKQSQVRWPFEEEIWEDEIEFMRTKNPTKCAVAAAH